MNTDQIIKLIGLIASFIVTGFLGYFIKYLLDKRQQFITKNAEFKRTAYYEVIALLLRVLSGDKQKPFRNGELVKIINSAYGQCILYASPNVVNAFGDTMQYVYNNDNGTLDSRQMMILITRIYKAMREDIGLSNKGLGNDAERLMRVTLKDYDSAIENKPKTGE